MTGTITVLGAGDPVARLRRSVAKAAKAADLELVAQGCWAEAGLGVATIADACAELPTWRSEAPGLAWLLVGEDSAAEALRAVSLGAVDYLPWNTLENDASKVASRLRQLCAAHRPTPPAAEATPQSAAAREIYRLAQRVAPRDVPVFIQGPSGSGKEVLARFLHEHSSRNKGPFVAVNCAAIPENMLEATLFGHERGAFTGADRARQGKFLEATGGTLLLDEITEMAIELQPKLLRAIQEQEVEPLGSRNPVPTNLRIVATSNRDLKQAVADGCLRQDLYYRLNVFPLNLPSLRERRDDIVPLGQRFAAEQGVTLSEEAGAMLLAHDWPGNVRELENCIARASIVCHDERIQPADLGLVSMDSAMSYKRQMMQQGDELIVAALQANEGRRKDTAASLGISERTLRYRLARLRASGAAL
jgi:two-component system response regulator FlrC